MYRLTALPFLEIGMSVAIVGYKTYPDADVTGQVEDLDQAIQTLYYLQPDLFHQSTKSNINKQHYLGTCLIGHSSGAHISLLMLVQHIQQRMLESDTVLPKSNRRPTFDTVIGLSGPYSIDNHFDFEAHRGVEELSPMKPACGFSRESFQMNSPGTRLALLLRQFPESGQPLFPQFLLVHGMEDSTVPFTATSDAAVTFRSCGVERCDELYIGQTGHQETIMHFMFGGKTKDAVLKWLQNRETLGKETVQVVASSKL